MFTRLLEFAQSRKSRRFILNRAAPKLKIFSRAGRAVALGRAGLDGFLSRAGRDGFFSVAPVFNCQVWSRQSGIATKNSRWSGITKFGSRRSFPKSRTSTRALKQASHSFRIFFLQKNNFCSSKSVNLHIYSSHALKTESKNFLR